jgi:prefoldin subunit 5
MNEDEMLEIINEIEREFKHLTKENEMLGEENEKLHDLINTINNTASLDGEDYTDGELLDIIYDLIKNGNRPRI